MACKWFPGSGRLRTRVSCGGSPSMTTYRCSHHLRHRSISPSEKQSQVPEPTYRQLSFSRYRILPNATRLLWHLASPQYPSPVTLLESRLSTDCPHCQLVDEEGPSMHPHLGFVQSRPPFVRALFQWLGRSYRNMYRSPCSLLCPHGKYGIQQKGRRENWASISQYVPVSY